MMKSIGKFMVQIMHNIIIVEVTITLKSVINVTKHLSVDTHIVCFRLNNINCMNALFEIIMYMAGLY